MIEWAELEQLIDRRKVAGVAAAVRGLTPQQRKALAEPLRQFERKLRTDPHRGRDEQPALAVAGAGLLPGASALAPWLARNNLDWREWEPGARPRRMTATGFVIEVLRDRDVPWLPDLTRRLVERLPARRHDGQRWGLVTSLVSLTGIDPPATDGFVIHWAVDHPWGEGAVEAIRGDPRLTALVPRLFEIDEVALWFETLSSEGWPAALAALAAEGLADRGMLLDCCLGGLQRSGRLGALRGLLQVHDALSPDLTEIAGRTRDYLALLPGSYSTVTAMSQRQLRRLDEAGMLDAAVLREASESVLLRSEKTVVRFQLDWLDQAAARDPGQAGGLALAAAAAFGQQAPEVQARALTVVLRHRSALEGATREKLAAAAAALPPDMRARAARALGPVPQVNPGPASGRTGSAAGSPAVPERPPPLVAPAPADMPPPIGSAEELAAEISAIYAGLPAWLDPVALERVLAGLVAVCHAERAALPAALQPVLARYPWVAAPGPMPYHKVTTVLDTIICAAVGPRPVTNPPYASSPELDAMFTERFRPTFLAGEQPGPQAALAARLHEIAVGMSSAPRPLLVSAPSTSTGLIDPHQLLRRLRCAADQGWEPWRIDLAQALLRLPREPDAAAAARAADLGTRAGAVVARRLAAGAPADPDVTTVTGTANGVILATVRSATQAPADARGGPVGPGGAGALGDRPDACALPGDLAEPEQGVEGPFRHETGWMSCWPMMLPAHRDVIAAHVLPHLFRPRMRGRTLSDVLTALAAADGPAGPALYLAVGYGLAADDQSGRAGAVEALIRLAARGQLDGEMFGKQLGVLVGRWIVPLRRVVPGLRDAAAAGAREQVWGAVAAMLPEILPPPLNELPRQTADLITLGVDLAHEIRPTTTLPCLDPVAARRGSSQLIVAARRLRQALGAS